MYLLCDVNSMYASAEKVFDIEARKTGVVVTSNNDGCIVAQCKLAKAKVGDLKFQPYFKVRKQLEQTGIKAVSSNYELYADLSHRFMSILSTFAADIHVYSIDECFLRIDNRPVEGWEALGRAIRKRVWQEVRLPICVGIASTPTLAKAANRWAKKHRETRGVCLVDDSNHAGVLKWMAPEDVWGIGSRLGKRLRAFKISDAQSLAAQCPKAMRKQFSVNMERTVRELRGEPCLTWDEVRAPKQQIFSTRAFGAKVTDLSGLQQSMVMHAEKVSRKAREQGSLITGLMAFAHSSPFRGEMYRRSVYHAFHAATADARDLANVVAQAANQIYQPGIEFHKCGVGAIELVDGHFYQRDFFSTSDRKPEVMSALDSINSRYGPDTVGLAGRGVRHASWQMKRNMKTPAYTTDWKDLPLFKCTS